MIAAARTFSFLRSSSAHSRSSDPKASCFISLFIFFFPSSIRAAASSSAAVLGVIAGRAGNSSPASVCVTVCGWNAAVLPQFEFSA